MNAKARIRTRIRREILILDGATGTQLQERGMPAGVSVEVWAREHPRVLTDLHAAYCAAGSDIIYTCTFGANSGKLSSYGFSDVRRLNRDLARIARAAGKGRVLVAGDIGPSGQFVHPFGPRPFDEAVALFKEQVTGLLDGGVDLFVIETMMDIQEARAALIAVRELCDHFTAVTMTFEKNGMTLNGTTPAAAAVTLQSLGADALGCNCSGGPDEIAQVIRQMAGVATVPLIAKPNAGLPRLIDGKTTFEMTPAVFAKKVKKLARYGVCFAGGCCGTGPAHLERLGRMLRTTKPVPPRQRTISAVSSARTAVVLTAGRRPLVIGERINPTGKKEFQAQLRARDLTYVRQVAVQQEQDGAVLLDVNVGLPGIDETALMAACVDLLSVISPLPLVIDSSDPAVIERALRRYPGRALVNSISGERGKTVRLARLCARYGAIAVLLPLTGHGVPETFRERTTVIRRIARQLRTYGVTKDALVVDALTMSVASHPRAGVHTLRTIAWCARVLKVPTVIGLSNISFGMPERKLLNAQFLRLAAGAGLSLVIAHPTVRMAPSCRAAQDALLGNDPQMARYLAFARSRCSANVAALARPVSVRERIGAAIIGGDRDHIAGIIAEALSSGDDPQKMVQEVMIPSLTTVGELFDQRRYFLPQLIASAETMQRGFEVLKPHLERTAAERGRNAVIILATVEGDIHDIGKNIVALMLRNHGFEVVDLGRSVSRQTIVTAIRRAGAAMVGLSALMTTTMGRMKEVVDYARDEGLTTSFIVGGAVVTPEYARSIGAAYARDGVDAVRVALRIATEGEKGPCHGKT